MGPRHVHLLEDVERLGSIRAACVEVGLSYRTCMKRLRRMETVLGGKVLETHRGGAAGGGAQARTPRARKLLRVYRQWRTDLVRISDQAFQRALRVSPEINPLSVPDACNSRRRASRYGCARPPPLRCDMTRPLGWFAAAIIMLAAPLLPYLHKPPSTPLDSSA